MMDGGGGTIRFSAVKAQTPSQAAVGSTISRVETGPTLSTLRSGRTSFWRAAATISSW